jgi:2,3-dihydroxybiphenyl 1,2-dioxygenase
MTEDVAAGPDSTRNARGNARAEAEHQREVVMLQALGYVGINAGNLDDWDRYATGLLGMQKVDTARSARAFRMDDRRQRLVVEQDGDGAGLAYTGWEVADAAALVALGARLEASGIAVAHGSRALADERRVAGLIVFHDPLGNRIEACHGAEVTGEPFRPGRPISGFRTGPLGMGHVVLTVESVDAVLPFYVDVLGFRLSDYITKPFKAYFLHVNPRHHSLALIETGRNGLHHLMAELLNLDDVGQGYDVALGLTDNIASTLGRHTNDFVTSFYSWTPSGFMFEYGWGGRHVDLDTWQAEEMHQGPSLWGHDRTWLDEERQAAARAIRAKVAADGIHQPVQVLEGNHVLMPGTCGWWDGARRQGSGD